MPRPPQQWYAVIAPALNGREGLVLSIHRNPKRALAAIDKRRALLMRALLSGADNNFRYTARKLPRFTNVGATLTDFEALPNIEMEEV